jgi:glycosyltransferase involved in cell wall biosynthesis
MNHKVLIIGTVWPEPNSSAAGSRLLQLIEAFQKQHWQIEFASAAQRGEFSFDIESLNIFTHNIKINDIGFDTLIKQLNPSIVLFDRFIIEEQFGWRVSENCPDALKILDTIDLHCLRNERHLAYKQNREFKFEDLLHNELAKREIASIFRCDISLMISEVEMEILQSVFKIDLSLLHYCGFMYEAIEEDTLHTLPDFNSRHHFISIGNFLHEPNWDSVLYLKSEIWSGIRKQLPKTELHIYGAYTSQKVLQLHNLKEGFIVKDRAENVEQIMSKARVCLAPLRFGAGIKGKLADSMLYGTPNVTTNIGAESMHGDLPWNGFVADDTTDFISKAIELYNDEEVWQKAQQNGIQIINQYFEKSHATENLISKINFTLENLKAHRSNNFIGNLIQHHQVASSKYMALWIESKNKVNQK